MRENAGKFENIVMSLYTNTRYRGVIPIVTLSTRVVIHAPLYPSMILCQEEAARDCYY